MTRLMISPDDIERIDLLEGSSVYSNLATALVIGAQVAIFRPCFYKIDNLFERGQLFYTSRNILSLIEQGHVTVGAREGWYNRKFREGNEIWGPNYPWTDADTKVAEWAAADANLENAKVKRAIIAPPPGGDSYAARVLENSELAKLASSFLSNSWIPSGLLERVNHPTVTERGQREQIRVLVEMLTTTPILLPSFMQTFQLELGNISKKQTYWLKGRKLLCR